ncbi:MAG: class I SAM-dependent methyltransferase [Streptosporangiaceae bacterium]
MPVGPAEREAVGRMGETGRNTEHWQRIYSDRGPDGVSWFQADPALSVDLVVQAAAGDRDAPVIDVGGGASLLGSRMAADGHADVTVLDLSARALEASRRQDVTGTVIHLEHDLLTWRPQRRYRVWHDRAVFHFLTETADRDAYRRVLRSALVPGGHLILATFAQDGPTHCSGLPVARYSPETLAAELGDGFVLTASRDEQHLTPTGAAQHFTWITATLT